MEEITEQIMEHLLAGQEQMMAKIKAEMETNQEPMTARLEAKIKAKMNSHHETFEVLGVLLSPGWISTKPG
jgi:hypothetical protein